MAKARTLFAIVMAAWLAQVHGQAIYKCVGKDGKTSYSSSPCPNAKQIGGGSSPSRSSAPSDGGPDVSQLPNLRQGKWNWKNIVGDACGDPLAHFRRQISAAYRAAPELGCKRQLSAPSPQNTLFVLDCPADATLGGVNVRKGRLEISVFAPSPQSVRVATQEPGEPIEVYEATRNGDC